MCFGRNKRSFKRAERLESVYLYNSSGQRPLSSTYDDGAEVKPYRRRPYVQDPEGDNAASVVLSLDIRYHLESLSLGWQSGVGVRVRPTDRLQSGESSNEDVPKLSSFQYFKKGFKSTKNSSQNHYYSAYWNESQPMVSEPDSESREGPRTPVNHLSPQNEASRDAPEQQQDVFCERKLQATDNLQDDLSDSEDFSWIPLPRTLEEPAPLEVLEGYAMVDPENFMSHLREATLEYFSLVGRRKNRSRILERFPPQYPCQSPAYLFTQSPILGEKTMNVLKDYRLSYELGREEAMEIIEEYPFLNPAFYGPKIPSAQNSPPRTFELRQWDEITSLGLMPRQIDCLLLNLLRLHDYAHPLLDRYWLRFSDILDSYPSSTAENYLPILRKCLSHWMDSSFDDLRLHPAHARHETIAYVNWQNQRARSEYGVFDNLQEEQERLKDMALYALSHLSDCIGRYDLTGKIDIIKNVLRVMRALELLFHEEYKIKEMALLTFPLFDRDYHETNVSDRNSDSDII